MTAVGIDVDQYVRFIGLEPEEVMAEALRGVHGEGGEGRLGGDGQYMTRCPAPDHNDSNASFHWFATASRQIKFNCFAGCEYGDIMTGLGLKSYQLKPIRIQYDYFDREGAYLFTVERINRADGSKDYKQFQRREDGTKEHGNGLETGSLPLWLEPDLEEWKEDLRARGATGTLVIPEGEKDAHAIAATGEIAREGDNGFVTTAPQGASNWKLEHTIRVAELARAGVLDRVEIICDPDSAGYKRGFTVRESLIAELGTDWEDRILVWAPGTGIDIADECDRLRRSWRAALQPVDEATLALLIEEGSAASGAVRRMPLGAGAREGRMGMATVLGEDKIALVIAGEIRPVRQWDSGWVVEIYDPHDPEVREVALERRDLMSKAAFDRWLVGSAHIAPVPRNGVGTGEFALQLQGYLKWYCRTMRVPKVVVTPYLTWVDAESGEPAQIVDTAEGATRDEDVVFVTGDPDIDGQAGIRWVGTDHAGCRWGRSRTETDAAWAWARALTFGDTESAVTVAGWVGAMVAAPWLGRWMRTKPGLAIVAPSGSGKTHGSTRLMLQLAGFGGEGGGQTVAAFRRRLAQGGVASIQWIDDNAIMEKPEFKEILRVAASQGEHVLANPDAGTRATDAAKLVGCMVMSAEGVSWLESEVAMQDRFVVIRPVNPQARQSWMAGRDGELQWPDVQELMGESVKDGLTCYAGWTMDGIRGVVEGPEGRARMARWVEEIGRPKGRHDVGAFIVAMGLRAVLTWLYGVKGRAGDAWPGKAHERAANTGFGVPAESGARMCDWRWALEAMAEIVDESRARPGALPTIASTVMPSLLAAAGSQFRSKAGPGRLWTTFEAVGDEPVRNALRLHTQFGVGDDGSGAYPFPIAFRDGEDRVWVDVLGLARWYAEEGPGRNGAEARVAGPGALRDQMETLADEPEWAIYKDHKDGSRAYDRPGLRVRRSGLPRTTYRRFNAEVSAALLA